GDFVRDDLTPGVGPAGGADAVRQARAVATRAAVEAGLAGLVVGAPLVAAGAGSSLLRDGHETRDGSDRRPRGSAERARTPQYVALTTARSPCLHLISPWHHSTRSGSWLPTKTSPITSERAWPFT